MIDADFDLFHDIDFNINLITCLQFEYSNQDLPVCDVPDRCKFPTCEADVVFPESTPVVIFALHTQSSQRNVWSVSVCDVVVR